MCGGVCLYNMLFKRVGVSSSVSSMHGTCESHVETPCCVEFMVYKGELFPLQIAQTAVMGPQGFSWIPVGWLLFPASRPHHTLFTLNLKFQEIFMNTPPPFASSQTLSPATRLLSSSELNKRGGDTSYHTEHMHESGVCAYDQSLVS